MRTRALLLASAVALAAPAMAQPKTTLNVGIAAQDIGQLDPQFAVSTIDRVVAAWMFNGLVRFPPGSIDPAKLEPDLAEIGGLLQPEPEPVPFWLDPSNSLSRAVREAAKSAPQGGPERSDQDGGGKDRR